MSATTTLNAPQQQVDALIQEAADKAGLELGKCLLLVFVFEMSSLKKINSQLSSVSKKCLV